MAGFTTNDQGICAIKSETTYATDAFAGGAPADADVLPVANVQIQQRIERIEGDRLTATIAGECHGLHLSHNDVAITTMLLGSPAAGTAPPVDALLKAAGFRSDVDAGVSVTYTPVLTQQAGATVLHYQRNVNDGNARRMMARGVRGNLTINLEVGQEATIEFAGQGLYDAKPASDAAMPALPEEYGDDQCAWIVNSLTVTVGATTYPVEALSLETNWTLDVIRTGAASGGGSASAVLLTKPKSGQRIGGSFTLVDGGAALTAAIIAVQGGAKLALSASLSKGSRTITIAAAAIQLDTEMDDQSPRYAIPYYAVRADGDDGADHLTITFT